MAALTAAAAAMGDAILVPVTEVGSLAVGVGWLSACAAYLARSRRGPSPNMRTTTAWVGSAVATAIVLMKVVPAVPGSFTGPEWIALSAWSGLGLVFWMAR
jgi:hypothetical protein